MVLRLTLLSHIIDNDAGNTIEVVLMLRIINSDSDDESID